MLLWCCCFLVSYAPAALAERIPKLYMLVRDLSNLSAPMEHIEERTLSGQFLRNIDSWPIDPNHFLSPVGMIAPVESSSFGVGLHFAIFESQGSGPSLVQYIRVVDLMGVEVARINSPGIIYGTRFLWWDSSSHHFIVHHSSIQGARREYFDLLDLSGNRTPLLTLTGNRSLIGASYQTLAAGGQIFYSVSEPRGGVPVSSIERFDLSSGTTYVVIPPIFLYFGGVAALNYPEGLMFNVTIPGISQGFTLLHSPLHGLIFSPIDSFPAVSNSQALYSGDATSSLDVYTSFRSGGASSGQIVVRSIDNTLQTYEFVSPFGVRALFAR